MSAKTPPLHGKVEYIPTFCERLSDPKLRGELFEDGFDRAVIIYGHIEELIGGARALDKLFKLIEAVNSFFKELSDSLTTRATAAGLSEHIKITRLMMSIPMVISGFRHLITHMRDAARCFGAVGIDGANVEFVKIDKHEKKVKEFKLLDDNFQKVVGGIEQVCRWMSKILYMIAFGGSRPLQLTDRIVHERKLEEMSEAASNFGKAFPLFIFINHICESLATGMTILREWYAHHYSVGEYRPGIYYDPKAEAAEAVKLWDEKDENFGKLESEKESGYVRNMVMNGIKGFKNCLDVSVDSLKLFRVPGAAVGPYILAANLSIALIDVFELMADKKCEPKNKREAK